MGFLYVFRAGDTNRYKIGSSKGKNRKKTLETGSSLPLIEIREEEFVNEAELEKRVHHRLQAYRAYDLNAREWFQVDDSEIIHRTIDQEMSFLEKRLIEQAYFSQQITEIERPDEPLDEEIEPDQEILEALEKVREIHAGIKLLESEDRYWRSKLAVLVGRASGVKGLCTYRFQMSSRLDTSRIKEELPEIYREYSKLTVSRCLRPKL